MIPEGISLGQFSSTSVKFFSITFGRFVWILEHSFLTLLNNIRQEFTDSLFSLLPDKFFVIKCIVAVLMPTSQQSSGLKIFLARPSKKETTAAFFFRISDI